MKITSINIDAMKIIGSILLLYSWYNDYLIQYLPFILICLFIKIKLTWKK